MNHYYGISMSYVAKPGSIDSFKKHLEWHIIGQQEKLKGNELHPN